MKYHVQTDAADRILLGNARLPNGGPVPLDVQQEPGDGSVIFMTDFKEIFDAWRHTLKAANLRNYVAAAQSINKQYVADFTAGLVLALEIIISLATLYEVEHTDFRCIKSRIYLRSFCAVHMDTVSGVSWNNLNCNLLLFD
jgi:hypothetical protein